MFLICFIIVVAVVVVGVCLILILVKVYLQCSWPGAPVHPHDARNTRLGDSENMEHVAGTKTKQEIEVEKRTHFAGKKGGGEDSGGDKPINKLRR